MKINDNLYKKMLQAGKEILIDGSYKDLTIRRIAEICDVSVGTVYNCFPSKEMLVATIILKDWNKLKEKAENDVLKAKSCAEGFEMIFNMIRSFIDIYNGVFDQSGVVLSMHPKQLEMLIEQLGEMIHGLLDRFEKKADPDPTHFLAEVILLAGCRRNINFDEIRVFLERIAN